MGTWDDKIYNYYALALAICNFNFSVDSAIDQFSTPRYANTKIPKEVALEMAALKEQGKTYRQIGVMYGIKPDAVYNRIRRSGMVR